MVVGIDFLKVLEAILVHRLEVWTSLAEVIQTTLNYLVLRTILILECDIIFPKSLFETLSEMLLVKLSLLLQMLEADQTAILDLSV